MAIMLVTVWSIFFVRIVKRASPSNYLIYVVTGALCSYVHFFAILMLPAQIVSLWFFRPNRGAAKRLILSMLAIAILSGPAIAGLLRASGLVSWISPSSIREVIQFLYVVAGASRDIVPGSVAAMVNFAGSRDAASSPLLILYLIAIGLCAIGKPPRASRAYVLLCVIIPIVAAIVVSMVKPLFVPRYLLMTLPFVVIAAAMGIRSIPSRTTSIAITAVIIGLSLIEDSVYYRAPAFQDWRGAVGAIAERAHSTDVVVIYPRYNQIAVNYYRSRLSAAAGFPPLLLMVPETDIEYPEALATAIAENRAIIAGIAPHARIWFVGSSPSNHDGRLIAELRGDREVAEPARFSGVKVLLMEAHDGR